MEIIIDAMGGDNAPSEIVKGAAEAAKEGRTKLVLVGNKLRIEQCLQKVLEELPKGAIIKDFDVMFHPDYEIDVLRILLSQVRIRPFSVLWPGRLEGRELIYAEEGFRDYKVFDISNYDVTCVI